MTAGNVIFYDYAHCQQFLESHVDELRRTATGLAALGLYRAIMRAFTHEALETSAITLGQLDHGLVFLFVPDGLGREHNRSAHRVARDKGLEMLASKEPPLVFELLAAETMNPPLAENARCRSWMKDDLYEILETKQLEISVMINGAAFFDDILVPSLVQNGFSTPDEYLAAAKAAFVRVRHPKHPGKVFKLPWIKWFREMFAGGYSMAYLMACLGTSLNQMTQAINKSASPTAQG